MKVSEIRFSGTPRNEFLCYVSITLESKFAVNGMKIIRRKDGQPPMLCMPDRLKGDGTYADVAHPITADYRRELEELVFKALEKERPELMGVKA